MSAAPWLEGEVMEPYDLSNGRHWCIAGGWAACPQLAEDQDFWIFVDPDDRMIEVRDEIIDALRNEGLVPEYDDNSNPPYLLANATVILRVGRISNRHILITNASNVHELLETFDISTHQCAITENLEFVKGCDWTPITEIPIIIRANGPTTQVRFQKIFNRYAFLRNTHGSE